MRKFVFGALAGATLLASTAVANANLVANGDFETPVVPVGNFTIFSVGSASLTSWSVVGPAGTNVAIVSGSFVQNGVTFNAQSGAQWLDLTGFNSNTTEGVAQTIATTIGDQYQLTYFIGNTTGGSIFGTTSTVNVTLNGSQTFSHTNSSVNATGLTWQMFTDTFVATGTSTTIGFLNGDPSNDNSNGLDNIGLIDQGPTGNNGGGTSVPEPASLTLLGAGLIGLGWFRRRRSR
ncbi:MAG TPA: DUF642 domain-containing protein [Candidatus Cybelea sp.]|nr:DUF642 domain-containing protein [Candidatus Cybelea sp.]